MTSSVSTAPTLTADETSSGKPRPANPRALALAERLERGANALIAFMSTLTDEQWQTRLPGDGRKVGVVVHHVAFVYPPEIQIAQALARGGPAPGLTMADIHEMNAGHARDRDGVTKEEAKEALWRESAAAAAAIRALRDDQLDNALALPLYGGATVTCQFVLEDHAVRHSYHHLARLRKALQL